MEDNIINSLAQYIDEQVLQSKVWDVADSKTRLKAYNNSKRILNNHLKKYYPNEIPLDHLAEQVIWMLKIDDSLQRSEMGITYIQIDGISMNISDIDRTICPYILRAFNLPKDFLNKRRVAKYGVWVRDTSRRGYLC